MSTNATANSTAPPVPMGPNPALPHDSLQPNIIVCVIVTWLFAMAFVWARFYTKSSINRAKLTSSEWCLMVALVRTRAPSPRPPPSPVADVVLVAV